MVRCRECKERTQIHSVVSYAIIYQNCMLEKNRLIAYSEKELPKTAPHWCPMRGGQEGCLKK